MDRRACQGGEPQSNPAQKPSAARPATSVETVDKQGVRWLPLTIDTLVFFVVEHGFRLATEEETVKGLSGQFFDEWGNAIGHMHGWTDRDPFFVNYIGHPIMGAVSNRIWINNDPEYKLARFGANRRYWRSRMRSAAYGFAFSAAFEVAVLSEADIGNVQSRYPAQGFVDWVITPVLGIGLVIGEDALDRYVVEKFEDKYKNTFARVMMRSWLAPDRAFANALTFRLPWARENRDGVKSYLTKKERGSDAPIIYADKLDAPLEPSDRPWTVPSKFDVDFHASIASVGAQCVGAAGTMLFNFKRSWSIVAGGGGCKLYNLPANFSGDLTQFEGGLRYTWFNRLRFQPYLEAKLGVVKMYQREVLPAQLAALAKYWGGEDKIPNNDYYLWANDHDSTAPLVSGGGGVMFGLTRAFSLRLASIDYTHT